MRHSYDTDTDEASMRVRITVQTRLGVLVPIDNIRRTVVPGLRSVYYCPQVFPGGSGIVMDGLLFELYVCADVTLTDDMLYSSLLWGYLGGMKRSQGPDSAEGFPPTLLGDALALVADGEDEHVLEVTTLSQDEASALQVHPHKRFVDEKCVTRLARVRTRFHPLFVSMVDRLRANDKLVRNRNDPTRRAEYNCLLLVAKLTGKKTREGKWKGMPVSRLLPVTDPMAPLTQLADQMRLRIDDFERLAQYERKRIIDNALERSERIAGADFQELGEAEAGAARHFDPRDLSGFSTGNASQFFASMPHRMLAACHGAIVATHMRMPRGMVEPIQETHRLLGTRPWFIENDVSVDTPKMIIDYALIRFQRSMALEGAANTISFKTPDQLLRELPPIVKPNTGTAAPGLPSKKRKRKTAPASDIHKKRKMTQTKLDELPDVLARPIPMQARLPPDLRALLMSVHIKTE